MPLHIYIHMCCCCVCFVSMNICCCMDLCSNKFTRILSRYEHGPCTPKDVKQVVDQLEKVRMRGRKRLAFG